MFRLQKGISKPRVNAVCHAAARAALGERGFFPQRNKFLPLRLVNSGTILQRISTIIIIKKKEKEEEIYGYIRQGDATARTINVSMLSTKKILDKRSITRGFWPPNLLTCMHMVFISWRTMRDGYIYLLQKL